MFLNGLPKQILNLAIDAAQLTCGPGFQFSPKRRINAQEKRLSFHRQTTSQLYNVPVFTTGCTSDSPQSTTSRLLTIAAFRSLSSSTTRLSANSFSAISTMLTAPCTIF